MQYPSSIKKVYINCINNFLIFFPQAKIISSKANTSFCTLGILPKPNGMMRIIDQFQKIMT